MVGIVQTTERKEGQKMTIANATVADFQTVGIRGYYVYSPRGFANDLWFRLLLADPSAGQTHDSDHADRDTDATFTAHTFGRGEDSSVRGHVVNLLGDIAMYPEDTDKKTIAALNALLSLG